MHAYDFLLDTYETERLKTLSVWSAFADADMEFRPAPRARSLHEQMVHQSMSEDNWIKGMLGVDTGRPPIPAEETRLQFLRHYADLSGRRLAALRERPEEWWTETAKFFDVDRTRSWIMLRRLTHSAHHRAQLIVYLRLLGRPVYSTYGPTADTGGLPANKPRVIYRYPDIEELLRAEADGGRFPQLPGPGNVSPTERPATGSFVRSVERVPIRTRESGVLTSAWRMVVDSESGSGTITVLEGAYRGDGIFLGWSQERLAAEYQRLHTAPDEPTDGGNQLG